MNQLISDIVNGNLADAKLRARRFSHVRIAEALRSELGYSEETILACLLWLKCGGSFQAYCDAQQAEVAQ